MQLNDQTALAPIIIDGYTASEIIINQTAYLHNVQLGDDVAPCLHASPHDLALPGAALECMTTAAACRTYALLASEGRKVWAWLWV